MHWNLFPILSAPMPLQMTLDRLLFEKFCTESNSAPLLRVFYSSQPWVTVGYAAEKKSGYALESSRHELKNIPVCRRLTGGGTVIHGTDLIFSLMARRDTDERFESLDSSYRYIHEAVKLAFEKLGVKAGFYSAQNLTSGRDCFLFPVETDLHLNGKKIAGGAQKRSGDFFLHEESIQPPVSIRAEDLQPVLLQAFKEYFQVEFKEVTADPALLIAAEKQASECLVHSEEVAR